MNALRTLCTPGYSGKTGHGVQLATTVTRAWSKDDGSSTNSLKLISSTTMLRRLLGTRLECLEYAAKQNLLGQNIPTNIVRAHVAAFDFLSKYTSSC